MRKSLPTQAGYEGDVQSVEWPSTAGPDARMGIPRAKRPGRACSSGNLNHTGAPTAKGGERRGDPLDTGGVGYLNTPLAQYLREQLTARGKSIYFIAAFTGIDGSYLRRLAQGEKLNPGLDKLVLIAFALVACQEQFAHDPRLPMVLPELLLAAGYTAAPR